MLAKTAQQFGRGLSASGQIAVALQKVAQQQRQQGDVAFAAALFRQLHRSEPLPFIERSRPGRAQMLAAPEPNEPIKSEQQYRRHNNIEPPVPAHWLNLWR